MRKGTKKIAVVAFLAVVMVFSFAFSSFNTTTTNAAPYATSTWSGMTTGIANVRSGANTSSHVITTYASNTRVTVYATVSGQVVWGGISKWYRISSLSSAASYIYGALVTAVTSTGGGGGGAPSTTGQSVVVSLSQQWLYAYQNGKMVFNAAVITGRPSLPTPLGTYHVFLKLHPTWFYSPWPPGSPYWYAPTYINYALEFKEGGFFLHDSYWHTAYGPGNNGWHQDPVYGWQWGSHGCVSMPLSAAQWIYNWAGIGTTVQIKA